MNEIRAIVDQLQRAFEGHAWHGQAVRELLADVSAAQANTRPIAQAHSIWEIVLHISTWEHVVRRRLQGEAINELPDAEDWPAVRDTGEGAWRKAVHDLEERNRALRDAVAQLDEARLTANVPGKDHSVYIMLHGIIQHDLYHAGQIAVLKKAKP
jgi:uncharacterized damage-inducible protein DinB